MTLFCDRIWCYEFTAVVRLTISLVQAAFKLAEHTVKISSWSSSGRNESWPLLSSDRVYSFSCVCVCVCVSVCGE